MTEEQLGQLMQAKAFAEGHRPRLPEMSQFSAHLQTSADEKRRQIEADVVEVMAFLAGPVTPREITRMIPDANVDNIQNALRRLKSRGIVRTVVITMQRINRKMWVLA